MTEARTARYNLRLLSFDGLDPAIAPVLDALTCDMHASALLAATLASWANGLVTATNTIHANQIRRYVPQDPMAAYTVWARLTRDDLTLETQAALGVFLSNLAAAQHDLEPYLNDAQRIGERRAGVLHASRLVVTWRSLCGDAMAALSQLESEATRFQWNCHGENHRLLVDILESAAEGRCPCLDYGGRLSPPELPQRRHTLRRMLWQDCTVRQERLLISAIVRDISTGGLGLMHAPGLRLHERAELELTSGRILDGVVVWTSETSAGVTFARPLPPDDPLLAS